VPELILHHFEPSPFAEKVRLMFGLKGLPWRSVQIPMVMPKPDLTLLTGGYRKTPVLQIGADIYCDTRLIAVELEKRFPQPTFFPGGNRGMSLALASWSDRAFFEPGAALSMGLNKSGLPQAIINDRKAFFKFMDFDMLERDIPHLSTQLRAQADLVNEQLADGRDYVFGNERSLADVHAYFVVWMVRGHVPTAQKLFAGYDRMLAWEVRMQATGQGTHTPMAAAEAHDAARISTPQGGSGADPDDESGLEAGERVVVTPDDYGCVPVVGELLTLTLREIAISRSDPKVGTVAVHFPRIGYRIARA